jgi:preprotein translocase subunit YajC
MKLAVRDRIVDDFDEDDTDVDDDVNTPESTATELTESPNHKTDG